MNSTTNDRRGPRYRPPPPNRTALRLHGNEGRAPDRAWIARTLAAAGIDGSRYPDARPLENALAARFGVDPERVLVTAGADEALDRACRAFLRKGDRALAPAPGFEMTNRYVRLSGAEVVSVPWNSGAFPVADVRSLAPSCRVIFLTSPQNPTGGVISESDLVAVAEAAPDRTLVADLAYVEFADTDPTPRLLELPNVMVMRTFSKAWGLAGLRVGYAIGAPGPIDALRHAGGPYSVAAPSLVLAEARLADGGAETADYVSRVRWERDRLRQVLAELGVVSLPSAANFVLARFDDAAAAWSALASLGVAVRRFPNTPELTDALRITCPGNPESFQLLESALRTALDPEALLFDMDGVLADVSRSYRAAIIETAGELGVRLAPEDVSRAKAEGDANDDWALTRALLRRHGVDVPQETVTARFEAHYQGTADRPGLREEETLLADPSALRELGRRLPLAIVTGRPRADALAFLRRFDLEDVFPVVVCREDAPLKPDPGPVRIALERLGVARAWMLGDTRDDVVAAKAARVLPLGVLAPGEGQAASAVLEAAGASKVLANANEVEELLP